MLTVNNINTKIGRLGRNLGTGKAMLAELSRDVLTCVYGIDSQATEGTIAVVNKLVKATEVQPALNKKVVSFLKEFVAYKFDSVANCFTTKSRKKYDELKAIVQANLADPAWDMYNTEPKEPKEKPTDTQRFEAAAKKAVGKVAPTDIIAALIAAGLSTEDLQVALSSWKATHQVNHTAAAKACAEMDALIAEAA